ncbi:unnamed protein product [Urochloa decumbens]|uniref:Uncharacterized protein n=1 Tax=Urochloa decumbens TaxID=240449 RepID=A0ABC8ZUB9_9POAL
MLRLQSHLLSAVRAASPLLAACPHHHLQLHSTAAAATSKSAAPFAVEDYLVTTCGLTPAQALVSSKYLAHLKSPSKPDSVLAFFAEIGLEKDGVAAAIAKYPRVLCSKVRVTLAPRIAQLREIGLSPSQISRFIAIDPVVFVRPVIVSRLAFYLSYLGSYDKLHAAVKRYPYLLNQNVESVVRPNIVFLRQCGLSDHDIAKCFVTNPRMFLLEPECLKEIVMWADKLGVPRNSAMFRHVLMAICCVRHRRVGEKLDFLKKVFGCSEAEMSIAVRKMPFILSISEGKLSSTMEFLKMEIGLETAYIVQRPALLTYSMKLRLVPRHYVLKVLKEKELVKKDADFFTAIWKAEEKFIKKYLDPYKESVPGLTDAYAAACAGQVPPVL